MDLQLSVFLLFILFTAGHSLDCYECSNQTGSCAGQQTVKTCPAESTQCVSSTTVGQVGGISSTAQVKNCSADCQSFSYNLGILRKTVSCCNTDKCNAQDAPEPVLTGKKCYYCDEQKNCSNILDCSGTEDRCIKATEGFGSQPSVVKGCASKSICDATTSVRAVESFPCCEGNLCNRYQSVPQTTQSVTKSSSDSTTRHCTEYIACILIYLLVWM